MPRRILMLGGPAAAGLGILLCLIWLAVRPGAGELSIAVQSKRSVMTVAYKVYGNPEAADGKYWLSKLVFTNTGAGPIRDLKVSYQVPDFIPWTTPDQASELLPGQTVVAAFYPKFPSKVTQFHTRTPSSLEIKIEYADAAGQHSKLEKREFEFRGVTEIEYTSLPADEIVSWFDIFDNHEILAAYVQDEDPAIKTYYGKVAEVSGGIGVMSSGKDLNDMMRSVYHFMLSTGMTYSGAKGVPEDLGNVSTIIQSIRLPRDVIYGNSGLCVELAMLWASIGQAAGAKAYVILLPGHAFPMLEANDGTRIPIEATAIGGAAGGNLGPARAYEAAVERGIEEMKQLYAGAKPYVQIDIAALQAKGIRPPELPEINRADLTRLLDDMRARRGGGGAAVAPPPNAGGGGGGGRAVAPPPSGGNYAVYQEPNGIVAVPYPASWVPQMQSVGMVQQVLPGYVFAANDPASRAGVEVILHPRITSPLTAMQQYGMAAGRFGIGVSFGGAQKAALGGQAATGYAFTASTPAGPVEGLMVVAPCRGGMVSIVLSAPRGVSGGQVFGQVLSNVRIGR